VLVASVAISTMVCRTKASISAAVFTLLVVRAGGRADQ
jgi:hypothetical protein